MWVNSNGQQTETRSNYVNEIKEARLNRPEHLNVRTYSFRIGVYVGDWIILKQDGHFDVMRPQEFAAAGYVQV